MDQMDQTGSFAAFDAKQKKQNPGLVTNKATSCLHNLSSATAVGISSSINSLYAEPSGVTAHRRVSRLTLIYVFTTAVICSWNKRDFWAKYNIWFSLKRRVQRLFDAIVRSSFIRLVLNAEALSGRSGWRGYVITTGGLFVLRDFFFVLDPSCSLHWPPLCGQCVRRLVLWNECLSQNIIVTLRCRESARRWRIIKRPEPPWASLTAPWEGRHCFSGFLFNPFFNCKCSRLRLVGPAQRGLRHQISCSQNRFIGSYISMTAALKKKKRLRGLRQIHSVLFLQEIIKLFY